MNWQLKKNGAEKPWEQRRGEMRRLRWVGTFGIDRERGGRGWDRVSRQGAAGLGASLDCFRSI